MVQLREGNRPQNTIIFITDRGKASEHKQHVLRRDFIYELFFVWISQAELLELAKCNIPVELQKTESNSTYFFLPFLDAIIHFLAVPSGSSMTEKL